MNWYSALGALLVGLCAGVLSGAVGVGGAVISTPGIRILGASPIMAVGTTLPAILPSAAMGTFNYARAGLVNYRVVLITALAGGAASVGGAYASDYVGGRILMFVTAGLVGENSLRMARDARRLKRSLAIEPAIERTEDLADHDLDPEGDDAHDAAEHDAHDAAEHDAHDAAESERVRNTPLVAGIGVAAGFVSGLLGVGGGVIMVPAFYRVLGMPVKQTVATSLLVVGILSVPGTVIHSYLGHIDWKIAGFLAVGVIPGAYVGSRFTVRTDEIRLRVVVAVVLALIAAGYIAGEIRSILAG